MSAKIFKKRKIATPPKLASILPEYDESVYLKLFHAPNKATITTFSLLEKQKEKRKVAVVKTKAIRTARKSHSINNTKRTDPGLAVSKSSTIPLTPTMEEFVAAFCRRLIVHGPVKANSQDFTRYITIHQDIIFVDMAKLLHGWILKNRYLSFDDHEEEEDPDMTMINELVYFLNMYSGKIDKGTGDDGGNGGNDRDDDLENIYIDMTSFLTKWFARDCWNFYRHCTIQYNLFPLSFPSVITNLCLDYVNDPEKRYPYHTSEQFEKQRKRKEKQKRLAAFSADTTTITSSSGVSEVDMRSIRPEGKADSDYYLHDVEKYKTESEKRADRYMRKFAFKENKSHSVDSNSDSDN